ncbi:hypothetical protein ABK040_010356 [Willaertia magna]
MQTGGNLSSLLNRKQKENNNSKKPINQKTKYEINTLLYNSCCKNVKETELFIEDETFQKFKQIVKQDEAFVEIAYNQLLHNIMNKNNSSYRYLGLLFINECMKSKKFRQLLSNEFKLFITLAVTGSEPNKTDKSTKSSANGRNNVFLKNRNSRLNNGAAAFVQILPPPERSAFQLRTKALEFIEQWNEVYGNQYASIKRGYEYIEKICKLQFPNLRRQYTERVERAIQRQEHTQQLLLNKYKKLKESELEEQLILIEVVIRETNCCLDQIVPTFDNLMKDVIGKEDNNEEEKTIVDENDEEWEEVVTENNEEEESMPTDLSAMMNDIGILTADYEITISLKDIFGDTVENVDNKVLFEICKENLREIKFSKLPVLKDFMSTLTKVELNDPNEIKERQLMLQRIIDYKNKLQEIVRKCEELKIDILPSFRKNDKSMEEIIENARKHEEEVADEIISKRKLKIQNSPQTKKKMKRK